MKRADAVPSGMRLTCSLSAVYVEGEYGVVAYVPEFEAVHAQGASIEEARANLQDALELVMTVNRREAWEAFRDARVLLRESILPPRPAGS
ncbi:MAG TPA: type II toxin-antitoxin system HicB family antitoxin [Rubrobacter sp.]|nr:type II toxin-antitoxin system HicB family antitoxin [Rubrobacter sp.]